jgi:hypothetical protein
MILRNNFRQFLIILTQVAKNHFAFATALLWHQSFEIPLKLYLYGKYSIQTMSFWYLCAFVWFKNIEKNAIANDKWFFAT